jgi:hypothetical protein
MESRLPQGKEGSDMLREQAPTASEPFCLGVFADVAHADQAIAGLLAAGFDADHISVICSNQAIERHFGDFEHEHLAGADTPFAATAGAGLGALAAGAATTMLVGTGGAALIAVGPLLAVAGGIVGGFVGAMTTRGMDRELVNFYEQAVAEGRILVACESRRPDADAKLAEAKRTFVEAGAQPVSLHGD